MEGLDQLLPLLQAGVASPALVILAVFAWNLNKSLKELATQVAELNTAIAVIENELGLEQRPTRGGNSQAKRRR